MEKQPKKTVLTSDLDMHIYTPVYACIHTHLTQRFTYHTHAHHTHTKNFKVDRALKTVNVA